MRSLRKGRTIHLLDLENLTASSLPTADEIRAMMRLYLRRVPYGSLDLMVAAVNPRSMLAAGQALPGARLLIRSGPDGADSALSEAAMDERVDARFERVVIGSGDGYFAGLAEWLAAAGVRVTVVTHAKSLSWRLYVTTPDITYLDPPATLAA